MGFLKRQETIGGNSVFKYLSSFNLLLADRRLLPLLKIKLKLLASILTQLIIK